MRGTPRTRRLSRHRVPAAVALACALTAVVQPPAHAAPETLSQVQARLQRLYHDAEVATDQYNAADEKVTAQTARVRALKRRVSTTEAKLARLTALAGAAARAQYRGGGLPAEMQFVLAPDPERALDDASLAQRGQQATRDVLTALTKTRTALRTRSADASAELRRLEDNRRTRAARQSTVRKNIAAARQLESQLAEKQRRELAALEKRQAERSQAAWEKTGVPERLSTRGSAAGRRAIAYATRQLGKPYVWGAEGPDSFDCSGLTSQAWLHAGVAIPRTSEEQWRQLTHVPVDRMRPGDLIIYFSDASHVALYIGDGKIIQAPRPGRWVYVSPAASMRILGVVRPDA
ncbi:NlpC/P60 family protein [Streptomyces sp. DSM 110735]|uniref:C40 family peptidase n=1 Tax=Streptomyces sp. DSM 110735 TaxID=2775031 RepID=UPI001A7EAFA3|nr:NlpC/P60 family protein [Streptomyces sp. DSM 110735]